MLKTIHVVAAILQKDDKILIAKRNYGQFKGLFEFPGGKIEEGESKEEALKREINEEFETSIKVNKFFMNVNYEYSDFTLNMDCFLCTLENDNLVLHDHSEIKWIDVNEKNIEWVPADISVIENLRVHYQQ